MSHKIPLFYYGPQRTGIERFTHLLGIEPRRLRATRDDAHEIQGHREPIFLEIEDHRYSIPPRLRDELEARGAVYVRIIDRFASARAHREQKDG